ncbi:hypothetical protein [Burkholderia ubonensis]|uniref:hypothetical protein n=1 Tax=Burkholderia ubonensis TaxID=101571 RepID=UPI000A9C9A13|nr:hypothetical protein [Burkholderia ubonensis]
MSDSMVGAIHVTLGDQIAPDETHAIAKAIALLRPVIMVDVDRGDAQAQIVGMHARRCIQLDWPQIFDGRTVMICKGAGRTMLVTLDATYYEHGAEPIVEAIQRVRGVASAEPVFVEDDHADAVSTEMKRIKAALVDLIA